MIGNVDAYQYRDSEIGQQGGYGNGIKDNRVSAYPIRKKNVVLRVDLEYFDSRVTLFRTSLIYA